MRIKDHFLRLAGIGSDKWHKAMPQAQMRDLHRHCDAIDRNDVMSPVELIGLIRIEAQRHTGGRWRFPCLPRPVDRATARSVIAAIVTQIVQLIANPNQRLSLALRLACVGFKPAIKLIFPAINRRAWLNGLVKAALGTAGSDDLPHCVPGQSKVTANLLDRFAFNEKRTPDLRNCLHDRHPQTAPQSLLGGPPNRIARGVTLGHRLPLTEGQFRMPFQTIALKARNLIFGGARRRAVPGRRA